MVSVGLILKSSALDLREELGSGAHRKHLRPPAGGKKWEAKNQSVSVLKLPVCNFASAFNKLVIKEDFQGFPNTISSPV